MNKKLLLILIIGMFLLAPNVMGAEVNFIMGNNSALQDSYVTAQGGTACSGRTPALSTDPRSNPNYKRSYVQFDISNISILCDTAQITNVTTYLYMFNDASDSATYLTAIHDVYDATFKQGECHSEGAQIDGDELVWNNQPCGTGIAGSFPSNTDKCNATAETHFLDGVDGTWSHWEITAMTKRAISNSRANVTYVILSPEDNANGIMRTYSSTETTLGSQYTPYLDVTCNTPDTLPPAISST